MASPFPVVPTWGNAATQIPGIVMQGETVDAGTIRWALSGNFFEKGTSPIPVVVVWSGRDQLQFLSIGGKPGTVAAKFHCVFLGGEFSTTSPGLIADAPVTDVKGLG